MKREHACHRSMSRTHGGGALHTERPEARRAARLLCLAPLPLKVKEKRKEAKTFKDLAGQDHLHIHQARADLQCGRTVTHRHILDILPQAMDLTLAIQGPAVTRRLGLRIAS